MITASMQLTTKRDAQQWASQLGLETDEQEHRMAAWIWANKPAIGCTYEEHPLRKLPEAEFWAIAGESHPVITYDAQ